MVDATLRHRLRSWRTGLSREEIEARSRRILERLTRLAPVAGARVILIYIPVRGEVDTLPLLPWARARGIRLAAPRIATGAGGKVLPDRRMDPFYLPADLSHLEPGPYGIPQPPDTDPVPLSLLDVVLVPGVAFDRDRFRLGYGSGFYDRFRERLSESTVSIGLAYSEQILPRIPRNPWEKPLDYLVSDDAVLPDYQL